MNGTGPESKIPWVLTRQGVIVMLFLVAGVFAIPLLAKSPAFGKKQKVLLTVLVTIYTVVLIGALVLFMIYMYKMAMQALG